MAFVSRFQHEITLHMHCPGVRKCDPSDVDEYELATQAGIAVERYRAAAKNESCQMLEIKPWEEDWFETARALSSKGYDLSASIRSRLEHYNTPISMKVVWEFQGVYRAEVVDLEIARDRLLRSVTDAGFHLQRIFSEGEMFYVVFDIGV